MARCSICNYYETRGGMCGPCCRSYDRFAFSDVSVRSAIVWAARRARRFEQRRARDRVTRKGDRAPDPIVIVPAPGDMCGGSGMLPRGPCRGCRACS